MRIFIGMLSVSVFALSIIMLNIVMTSVIMLSVVVLSVEEPGRHSILLSFVKEFECFS
jgi:hypothetical protein